MHPALGCRYPPARLLQTLVCVFLNFCRDPLSVLNCLPSFRLPQSPCRLHPPGRTFSVCLACYPPCGYFYRRMQRCRILRTARCWKKDLNLKIEQQFYHVLHYIPQVYWTQCTLFTSFLLIFVEKRKSRPIGRLFHISSIPANTITSLKERSLQQ